VTVTPGRTRPLRIDDVPDQLALSAGAAELAPAGAAPTVADRTSTGAGARHQQLADALRKLRTGAAALKLDERILMLIGGIIAPIGIVLVILGWFGAARTPYVFEQIPYLISGGLVGVALVFLGAFLYFAHWMTQVVKEQRAQSVAVVDAIARLQDELSRIAVAPAAPATGAQPSISREAAVAPASLVATSHGSMAHRPDCVVVAAKPGLRAVTPDDGLAACKLCDPYGDS
jgi:hypothetical protein